MNIEVKRTFKSHVFSRIYIYTCLPHTFKRVNTSLQIIDYNSKNKKIYVSNIKLYVIFADKELPLI